VNELIRKFERESGIELYGLGRDRAKWQDKLEKFTEMIVRECADVATVNQYQAFTPGYYVMKHFGVEE
jgi:hypothetical protein